MLQRLIIMTVLLCAACQGDYENAESGVIGEIAAVSNAAAWERLDQDRYNVALLLIEGTYNTELTAAMDIFHHTRFREGVKAMNVFTVSNSSELVTTFEGLHVLPDFNYTDTVPSIDILIIPAAEHNLDSDLDDQELIDFIKRTSEAASYIASHCDGAFLLAKTGLLNGHLSTTFPGDVEEYRTMFPKLEVVEDVLFVHDGRFITSAGGAKTFEASLYLAQLIYGEKVAEELAKGMVIDWDLDSIKYIRVSEKPSQLIELD